MAADRNVVGTVIDGVCRDVQRALGIGYPIYSLWGGGKAVVAGPLAIGVDGVDRFGARVQCALRASGEDLGVRGHAAGVHQAEAAEERSPNSL